VEAFDDAVGLRALRLGAGVVDVLDREGELVSYSCRSGLPQYSVPRSVSIRQSFTSWASKNGTTRSFRRSAAVIGVLRS
jgi:hypothetical protein